MRARGTALALAAALLLAVPALAQAWPNPANDRALLNEPIEDDRYDEALGCGPRSTPGIRLLESWIDRHFRGDSWGVYRCQKLSRDTWSLHSEGRALDWRLDAKRKRERRAANFLIARLLATDADGNEHALARRMGVQEIIFNCRSWSPRRDEMGPYEPCEERVDRTTAHRDHVHIGLNLPGAGAETSFWTSALASR